MARYRGFERPQQFHIVRPGDTLYKIAQQHQVSVQLLLVLNPRLRRRPNMIFVGERIRLI